MNITVWKNGTARLELSRVRVVHESHVTLTLDTCPSYQGDDDHMWWFNPLEEPEWNPGITLNHLRKTFALIGQIVPKGTSVVPSAAGSWSERTVTAAVKLTQGPGWLVVSHLMHGFLAIMGGTASDSDVDRLISKYGAKATLRSVLRDILVNASEDARPEGEERKKETDEVDQDAEGVNPDATVHGGDGNSGEVDSQAETSVAGARQATEALAERYASILQEKAVNRAAREEQERRAKNGPLGGDTSDEAVAKHLAKNTTPAVRKLARLLANVFRRWEMTTVGVSNSPRLDSYKLVREIASRRYEITRATKRELDSQPLIVISADVSGSCSACSTETLAAALAVMKVMPSLIVVKNFNGDVCDDPAWYYAAEGSTAAAALRSMQLAHEGFASFVRRMVHEKHFSLKGVVVFGDTQGLHEYAEIAKTAVPMVLLDNYRCSESKEAVAQPGGLTIHGLHVPYYAYGVNTADRAYQALLRMNIR